MMVPKGLGMIKRKNPVNQINLKEQPLHDEYADAFSNAVGRAKFVDSIALNYTQLNDDKAIQIVSKMDRETVLHLDLSNNPSLSSKFYDKLGVILQSRNCQL